MTDHRRARATLVGAGALLLWACLAVFTTATGAVPPFLLTALSFGVAFLMALTKWLVRGEAIGRHLRQPWPVWAVGLGGLFGYHALYFLAIKTAPPVEASLICYLWPLLIVLFSALLAGETLAWFHLVGVGAGLAGTVLIVGAKGVAPSTDYLVGYAAALGCAIVWSLYSVLSRRVARDVPTDAVGGFCGATALLALICHLAFETTVWPASAGEWLAVLALGLGPVGAAFFLWDHGVKQGDIKTLGVAAYATPLLSTLILLATGQGSPSWSLALAAALIVGGAVLGSGDLWRRSATG
ncbi:MAG: EamA family transporter [Alphaproteobacteria bacterium]|jgi:drug/metabolite transporter (DMT)-like permease|nr:EamA family transporter [Alphaproteobacteria bacterium]